MPSEYDEILVQLAEIRTAITSTKRVLNFAEAAAYLCLSHSYLYKLTSSGIIPFSKPNGKKIFFDREKLDDWLLSNGTRGKEEKDLQASTYISNHPAA